MDQTMRNLEATSYGVLEHLVERRALVATLCTRDAGIFVGLYDLPATMHGDPGERHTLVLGGLAVGGADPHVDRCANPIGVHSSSLGLYRNDTTDPGIVEL